jgi:uncharacterized RDD family membrane protein YckC
MKCKKCGNEYNSNYYFSAPEVCNDCFKNLSPEEQAELQSSIASIEYGAYTINDCRVRFGKRLLSALIDIAIYFALLAIVAIGTGFAQDYIAVSKEVMALQSDPTAAEALMASFIKANTQVFVIMNVIILAYFFLEILIGASVGKLILGLQIARHDAHPATASQLIARYAVKNISVILNLIAFIAVGTAFADMLSNFSTGISIVVYVGFFLILTSRHLALHDRLSGTAVYPKGLVAELEESSAS